MLPRIGELRVGGSEQGSSPSEHVVSACGAGERISCIALAEEGGAGRGRPSVTAPSATPSTTPSTTATRRRRAVSSAGPLSRGEARAPDLLSIEERTAPKLPLRSGSQTLPPRANSGRLLPVRLTRLQPGVPKAARRSLVRAALARPRGGHGRERGGGGGRAGRGGRGSKLPSVRSEWQSGEDHRAGRELRSEARQRRATATSSTLGVRPHACTHPP